MASDQVVSIAWDVLKGVVKPIARQFAYVMSSKRYVQDLQKEVDKLAFEAERVRHAIVEAQNNLRNVYDRVPKWLASADKALMEARDLLGDFEKVSKTCCYGTLPDPNCRYQFSRKAKHKIEVIQRLAREGSEFKDISFNDPAPGVVADPTPARGEVKDVFQSTTAMASASSASTSIKLREDDVFESRASITRNVMDALANNNTSVVGVYGLGGVGKSTLLVDAETRIREEKSFDLVAKADVSENPDVKRIQGEIAHALSLDIKNEECANVRAQLLRKRLENEERKKKVLIILDNLWKGLDLKSVGIPCGHDNKVKGCKLLLTSRNRDILRREMGCDKDYLLGGLQEEEAKRLFGRMVGDKVHDDEFKPLVDEALHKCAGLPFLIVAMAKCFKDADLSEWKDVLKQINMSKNEGISEVINNMLQLSYDLLKVEEAKSLLRLCVVYGVSEPSLENLLRYGLGLGLFREYSSIEEARDRLSSLIRTLQASSLLLDNGDAASFKIHDLVCEFVTLVASKGHHLLVLKDKDKSATQLSKDKLKSCRAICFPYVDTKELPEELDCPKLEIFLLFNNNDSINVPDSYFNSMRKLKVLNLTGICLTRSPLLFQFLKNLHTLCLDGCLLEDVAIVGELKGLQILSLVNSKIQQLPKEIGQLAELRLLDLNHCSQLQKIDPGVLGSLIKLEELYMENSFSQWNAVEQTPPTNASLIELNNMKKLYTLHVSIPHPSAIPEDLNVEKLTKYRIQIGNAQRWSSDYSGSRTLNLVLNSDILQKGCIQTTLDRTDDLYLYESNRNAQSICELSPECFPKLKHLQVENSPSVNYILQQPSFTAFETLESLLLKNLINLEKIYNNCISSKSFNALQVVRVDSCHKMEVLFPLSLLGELPQLKEIRVFSCYLMRGIIEADDYGEVELRNLHVLELHDLPDIKNFFIEMAPKSSTSHNQVGTQVAFFNGQQVLIPSLESLTMDGLPNLKNIWSDKSRLRLSNLRSLRVARCKSLSKVINSMSLIKLHKLHTLNVAQCDLVQEIFDVVEPSASGNIETLELTNFYLHRLPSLRHIWSKNLCGIVGFHKLKKLEVSGCDNLGFLLFPSMVQSIAQLRELRVWNCKKMEAIIMEEEQLGMETSETLAFPMLTCLSFSRLENLTCFSRKKCSQAAQSQEHVKSYSTALFNREVAFPSMETLDITGMDNIEMIWDNQDAADSFHKLKSLWVYECNKLKCVWDKELYRRVKFKCLRSVNISKCKSLASLCPASVARDLIQLEELEISECGIVELIENEGLVPRFEFPKLTSLELKHLPELKCIYTGTHPPHWPALKTLEVHGCNKVEILASQPKNEMTLQPLFLIEKVVFPNLETLHITSMDNMEMIWGSQVAADSFHNLKSLCVHKCNKLKFVLDKELHRQVKFQRLGSVSVSRCKNLTSLFPASVAKDLMQLEELEINECGIVELIKNEGLVPRFVFPKLTSLKLKHLPELKCIYTGTHPLHWPALKTLEVDGCNKVEIFASQPENGMPLQPLFLIEKGAFSKLQELKLDLSGQIEIYHGHFHDEEFFCMLRVLELRHMSKKSAISTCRFVQSLTNLEKLVVRESYLEELSTNLEAIEDPSHELKVILPCSRYIQHLNTLDVSHCDVLSNMFTPIVARNLVELTKLRISNCKMLREVINDEGDKEGHVVAFNQLKYVELDGLTGLRCFSSGGYTLMFPLLEDVIVTRCLNMKFFSEGRIEAPKLERVHVSKGEYFWKGNLNITIQNIFEEMATVSEVEFIRLSEFPEPIEKWHSKLIPIKSTWELDTLMVDKCPSFINAIPSRLMLVLDNMEALQVCDCESLKEIFDLECLESVEITRVLPRLILLNLVNLPKLRRLWNKDLQVTLRFNSLVALTFYNCSNLRHAFAPMMARCLANLRRMEIKECGQMEGVIAEEEGQGSSMENIIFPDLEYLELECLPNLICFLSGNNHTLECPELVGLTIAHCPKMRSLTWQSVMEIDHGSPSLFTPQVQFSRLESMVLSHMDNLSKIWTDGPQETLTFDHLREVEALNCKSLGNLFSNWVVKSLSQLKKLRVESCGLEEIITSGYDTPHSTIAQFLFPNLTSLVLHDMPQLKSFCPNLPTLNWPSLKELRVTHCDKLNMLSFETSMNKWTQRDDQWDLLDQDAHSSFERDFPNLERLLLVDKDIRMIQDEEIPNDTFGKPKALTLACFHDERAIFPLRFLLERFQNLQSLEVFCSSFEDIFPDEGLVDKGNHLVLGNLRELKLSKLCNLKRVWRKDYLAEKILQSIEIFEVWGCPGLTEIFPFGTSFQNLTELVVKNSSGLVHLVTVSAITNLVHLTNMTVIGCERMKEVVTNDGKGEGKVISFGKLERLRLQNLSSLVCFSSTTSCGFRFPSLFDIVVEECPKMRIFSKGELYTPSLEYVTLFRYILDNDWEGDLNIAIQKLTA
ncbi:uncharacterized protein LOC115691916 [Syzygium oleosum]|uniref:uncharacterized protein LOC115691916 n=1 Tax=Syzygium oleosum TaxID=219896 RepID=UPI0024BA3D1E|nr:uncharacterized protein LOC115691916 [Syzygium oleosum]